jgi:hypothetical protein
VLIIELLSCAKNGKQIIMQFGANGQGELSSFETKSMLWNCPDFVDT